MKCCYKTALSYATDGKVAVRVAGVIVAVGAFKLIKGMATTARLNAIKTKKRAVVAAEIAEVKAWVESDKDAKRPTAADQKLMINATITELQALILEKKWSSVYLLKVTYANLLAAHEKTNCVVAVTLEDAIACAKAADIKYETYKAEAIRKLPLLGMPFSIKDNINVKGTDSTLGVITKAFKPSTQDGSVVKQIRKAGGIILAKTNIPQTLLSYESWNDLFGPCGNPVKPEYTCGGSSGGEGALVALGGSVAGIGSDIGGSIRIPAHFCGIYGIKPSQFRIPNAGQATPVTQEAIASVLGPMARNMDDLTALFKATIADASEMDGLVMNVKFRDDILNEYKNKKKLRVAYYTNDGFVEASPACKRAVDETVAALKKQGHECVEIALPRTQEMMEVFYWFLAADGGKSVNAALEGDIPSPFVKSVLALAMAPKWVTYLVSCVASIKSKTMGEIAGGLNERSVREYYLLLAQRNELRHVFAQSIQGFDCIVAPGLVYPAPKQMATKMLSYGAAYTGLYNILDASIVTVPVTTVNKEKDQWAELDPKKTNNYFMTSQIRNAYNATEQEGLPVGVQVVCTRFSEEQVLGISYQVVDALKKN